PNGRTRQPDQRLPHRGRQAAHGPPGPGRTRLRAPEGGPRAHPVLHPAGLGEKEQAAVSDIDVVMAIFWGALALGCVIFLAREAWRQIQDWRLGRRLKLLEWAQRELAVVIER